MRRDDIQFAPMQSEVITLSGGLDIVTPALQLPPGTARVMQNMECDIFGGYTRVGGYERFSGQVKPSDSFYWTVNATITGVVVVGNTLTGLTSSATGVVIAVTSTYIVLTKVVGAFVNGESLQISAVTVAISNSVSAADSAASALLHAQYRNLAADVYRSDIAAVPGSGPIRGLMFLNDVLYAFRDNAGATACALYKQSTSGWTAVSLGLELSFTAGNLSISEGTVVTGVTSGATGTLRRQTLQSGTYAGGTAAGRMVFWTTTGTFQNAEALQTGGVTRATSSSAPGAITLLPGGTFETVNANFGGQSATRRVYGCDGVNRGFEFDGTTLTPIVTGMVLDAPTHVIVHKNHLFFSFGSSAQHSGIGTPFLWTLLTGSAELACGDTITGFIEQPGSADGGALTIFTRNRVNVLYGSSAANWNLVTYAEEQGAFSNSMQRLGLSTFYMDDRGITNLVTAQTYGNFQDATVTHQIQGWVNERKAKVKHSSIAREKNQYRIFFSDSYALFITLAGQKLRGMTPVLLKHVAERVLSTEMADGTEVAFFGSSNGMVYQMEKGTSFDGEDIEYFADLAFNHSKQPRRLKRYFNAMFETRGLGYAEFKAGYDLGYNSIDIAQPGQTSVVANFSNPHWDTGFWDTLFWDGKTLSPSDVKLEGTAENISIEIYSKSDYMAPLTFSAIILDYVFRRRLRG